MRLMIIRALPATTALVALLGMTGTCNAQAIWGGEIERAARPGAYVPHEGVGAATRYGYPDQPVLYFNQDPRRLAYLEYLDRVDRAERFGYRPPPPPKCSPPPPSRWRLFLGGLYFR